MFPKESEIMVNRNLFRFALTVCVGVLVFMTASQNESSLVEASEVNPLLAKWEGPYGGMPPFDTVKVSDFKPAREAAMAENLAEVDRIAANPDAPTFENTIVELEKSGATLDRVSTIYYIWGGNMASPEYQVVQREMAPKLSAMSD